MPKNVSLKTEVVNNSLHSFTSNAYGRELIQGSLGVHDSTGAFCFGSSPLGFIPCPKTRTSELAFDSSVLAPLHKKRVDLLFKKWAAQDSLFKLRRTLLTNPEQRAKFIRDNPAPRMASTVGFKVRTYASGEMTGGFYHTGRQGKSTAPLRSGPLESTELTPRARTKIRRSIECAPSFMKYFWTLTFSPDCLQAWQKDDAGCVRQDYAKYKLKKFLNTASHQQKRLGRDLLYCWVAEIQTKTTKNVHFHILVNQFIKVEWVTRVWAQAENSVHIAPPIKTVEHVAAYMSKYMTKGENSLIKGFRYQLSNSLNAGTLPKERNLYKMTRQDHIEEEGETTRKFLDTLRSMKENIEERGGHVLDFGFSVRRPRSERTYKNRDGVDCIMPGIDPRLGKQICDILDPKPKKNRPTPF